MASPSKGILKKRLLEAPGLSCEPGAPYVAGSMGGAKEAGASMRYEEQMQHCSVARTPSRPEALDLCQYCRDVAGG